MEALLCILFAFMIKCGPDNALPAAVPTPTFAAAVPSATSAPLATPAATLAAATPTTPATATPASTTARRLDLPPATGAKELERGPASRNMVALTYDAGAGATHTVPILDALKAAGLHVTMFMTGQWAEQNPDLLRRIVADGHELGNHSYSHPDFTTLSTAAMVHEMQHTEDIVRGITGKTTKPWFRPPFGARDARVWQVIGSEGYYSVYWTLDAGDWRTDMSAQDVLQNVSAKAQAGSIVVNHLDSAQTAQVLPQEIARLQARGLKIVTLSELFSAN